MNHAGDTAWIDRARQIVVAATLLGGFPTFVEAKKVSLAILGERPESNDLPYLNRIYGSPIPHSEPYIDSLQPDLLGEAVVLRMIRFKDRRSPEYTKLVFSQASAKQLQNAFEVLGRIGIYHRDEVIPWLREILEQDLLQRAIPAFLAAMNIATLTPFSPLADILHEFLEREKPFELALELASSLFPLTLCRCVN